MFSEVQKAWQLITNMGSRYVLFRTGFELKKRTGILKWMFLTHPPIKTFYTLVKWQKEKRPFFFNSKEEITVQKNLLNGLKEEYDKVSAYQFKFFSNLEYELGQNYDWLTNPDTGYKYDGDKHWVDINDYNTIAGDIKFVWEPSRFSHLYTIIRYDKHYGHDCSKQVFDEILKWIDANKINQGPNFKCSQEISLRVMNWIFALYYYSNSPNLTEQIFNKIQHYIYWQTKHVYDNINFSRIAVRNNHAITETLLLYFIGTLFPLFPDAGKWKKNGKSWFEDEIAYQIYEDGTFLQFSMNYHRVVIQLLTWAIRVSELNDDCFSEIVYDRSKKSIVFLASAMNPTTGWLPNYGANDGALFFKLNDNHFRDYRPQLEALSYTLNMQWQGPQFEDANWYKLNVSEKPASIEVKEGYSAFDDGGYYLYRKNNNLSFIRCGNHKDRPSQADNLHLDIWHEGINILHDGGSYKYNSNADDLKYFMGTRSHNAVMIDDYDQMEKGGRFIWYHWTQCEYVKSYQTDDYFYFEGAINAFKHVKSGMKHKRCVKIHKDTAKWEIEDNIIGKPSNMLMHQIWHTSYPNRINFVSNVVNGETIHPTMVDGYYAEFYGKKEKCSELIFSTNEDRIKTIITIN